MIYFDNAATSFLKPAEVEQAVLQSFHSIGNAGRGAHDATLQASRLIYETREQLADLFHVKNPAQIAFTCNATEALNIAITGMLRAGDQVISSVCEHNSVLRPLYRMEHEGVELAFLPTDDKGCIAYEGLETLYKKNTKAVIVTHASNLTGNVTDLKRISEFTKAHGLLFVVDASQTAGVLPIDVEKLGIDILCFTGHKGLLGPQGTGGIYVREGITLRPLKVGGSGIRSYDKIHPLVMPTALEAGTLNGHGIAGLHASLSYIQRVGIDTIWEKEMELADYFVSEVEHISGICLYGTIKSRQRVAIVSLNIRDYDSANVSDWLWEDYHIAVRAGAHCAPLMHQALGTAEQGAVRFSFSHLNKIDEVKEAVIAIRELAE